MALCERETETLRALAGGEWSETLHQHVDGCESCSLTLRLFHAMKKLSTQTEERPSFPNYQWVLVQACMQRESTMQKRLHRVSLLAAVGTIAAIIFIVTEFYFSQGYSPILVTKYISRIDASTIGLLIVLWILSEFQLVMLIKPKLSQEFL